MLKKLTVYLTVISILLSMPVVFASVNDISTEVNAIKLFEKLNVIDNADEYLGKLDSEMTRGEIAACIGGLLKDGGYSGDVQMFSDVPPTHKAFNEINILAQKGIILGFGDGTFLPDKAISYPEALALVLKMTGYGELINDFGGYPTGCYAVVRNYRLFSSPDMYAAPTVGNIFDLIYRAARENLFQLATVKYDSAVKQINETQTILSNNFDVYYTEGVLTSDGVVDIKSTTIPSRNEVMIDGIKYRNDKDYYDLLGQDVICFYKETDTISKTVVYMAPSRRNDVLEIKAKDVQDFKNMTLRYYKDNNRSYKVNLKNDIDIIYNDMVATKLDENMFSPDDGFVRLVDNDGDGKYDVVIIKSYESFVVNSLSEMNDELVIKSREVIGLPAVSVIIDGEDDTLIYNSNKELKDYTDIKINTVVSVASVVSEGKVIAKEIILCDDTVYGDVVGYNAGSDETEITIDDVTYNVASTLKPILEDIGIRNGASFYLDVFGNIVDVMEIDMSNVDLALGYIVNVDYDKHNKKVYLKVFTELGKFVIYDSAEKMKINGELYKDAVNIYDGLYSAGINEPQLIAYKISSNREVNYIDTAVRYDGVIDQDYYNRFCVTYPKSSFYYQKEQLSFGGKVVMDTSTKIFVIPANVKTAKDSDFQVIKPSDVVSSSTYTVEGYSLNNDRIPADAVVMQSTASSMPTTSVGMAVVNISSAANSEDCITYEVTLIGMNGIEKHMTVDTDVIDSAHAQNDGDKNTYKIAVGDIVRIDTNKDGEITKMVLVYDYDSEEIKNGMSFAGTYFHGSRAVKADVYRILGEYMQITNKDLSTLGAGTTLTLSDLESQRITKFAIVKYENVNGKLKFTMGSTKDLVPYTTSHTDYSKVVVYTHSANEKVIFVID